MSRKRLVWQAVWPTLLIASALIVFAIVAGAQWPDHWGSPHRAYSDEQLQAMRDGRGPSILGWQDVVIFGVAIAFLWIKSSLLIRRMRRPVDWLTIALVAANISFSMLYLLVIAGALWPVWFYEHPYEALQITRLWRVVFIISIGWGIVMLATLPPPPIQRYPESINEQEPRGEEESYATSTH